MRHAFFVVVTRHPCVMLQDGAARKRSKSLDGGKAFKAFNIETGRLLKGPSPTVQSPRGRQKTQHATSKPDKW